MLPLADVNHPFLDFTFYLQNVKSKKVCILLKFYSQISPVNFQINLYILLIILIIPNI